MCPCPHTHWILTEKKKVIQANIIKHSEFYGRKVLWKHRAREHHLNKGSREAPATVRKTALLKELAN